MLKTIFFDLDDTLLDFRRAEAHALSQALRELGVAPTPVILDRYHVINAEQWRLLEEGKVTRKELKVRRFEQLCDELGVACSIPELCARYDARLGEGGFLLPGAEDLLRTLAPRYGLYAATNGTAATQRSRLARAGIGGYFKGLFISQEMGCDKPSPAFFRACFDAIPEFDPAAALMVGDSLTSDILGGRRAGLRTCWFNPHGKPPRPDIPADYEITALDQLSPLLETL